MSGCTRVGRTGTRYLGGPPSCGRRRSQVPGGQAAGFGDPRWPGRLALAADYTAAPRMGSGRCRAAAALWGSGFSGDTARPLNRGAAAALGPRRVAAAPPARLREPGRRGLGSPPTRLWGDASPQAAHPWGETTDCLGAPRGAPRPGQDLAAAASTWRSPLRRNGRSPGRLIHGASLWPSRVQ